MRYEITVHKIIDFTFEIETDDFPDELAAHDGDMASFLKEAAEECEFDALGLRENANYNTNITSEDTHIESIKEIS